MSRINEQIIKLNHKMKHNHIFVKLNPIKGHIIFSYQKGAEEDEGNKVGVGKGAATFRSRVPRGWVAFLTTQTGQHDIMPSLTRSTPACRETHKCGRMSTYGL